MHDYGYIILYKRILGRRFMCKNNDLGEEEPEIQVWLV